MKTYIDDHRESQTPFDIVVEGETPGNDREAATDTVNIWANAGATWWIEASWELPHDKYLVPSLLERIQQGRSSKVG
jgi:hypothetical protein